MARLNKKCMCCSTRYSYCPGCSRVDQLAPYWKSQFCSSECKNLWESLVKYNMKLLTKADAKYVISSLELKPIESYAKCVQRDYAIVMADENEPNSVEIQRIDQVIDIPVVMNETAATIIDKLHGVVTENE